MGEIELVEPDIDKGYRLIGALDAHNLRPSAALWLSEDSVWRLVLQIPALENMGIRRGYQSVQRVIKTSPGSFPELTEITLVDPESELLKVLRKSFSQRFIDSQTRLHLTRTRLLGLFIEEAVVYRL